MRILKDNKARNILDRILNTQYQTTDSVKYKAPYISGYFKNNLGSYTSFDNNDGCCWVNDFNTREEAKLYT